MIRLINIHCHKCNNLFDFSTEIPLEHVFSVYCGVCGAENVIDLNPYKNREEESRTNRANSQLGTAQTLEVGYYDFLNEIPGNKPER